MSAEVPHYSVRAGDSLTAIARQLGITLDAIRLANGLASDIIQIGQSLAVPDALSSLTADDIHWARPVRRVGTELRPFGPYQRDRVMMPSTGADLSCPVGTRLTAPAHGIVRHVGSMTGVGTLLILEHGGQWATVLAPVNPATVSVQAGQIVLQGDFLGETASPPRAGDEPYLHLELRRADKAVAPDRLYK